jgi:hypothetical protein
MNASVMTSSSRPSTYQILQQACAKLGECTVLLEQLIDDPEVCSWLPELQGRDAGWYPRDESEHEYLADKLYLRLLFERGEAPPDYVPWDERPLRIP